MNLHPLTNKNTESRCWLSRWGDRNICAFQNTPRPRTSSLCLPPHREVLSWLVTTSDSCQFISFLCMGWLCMWTFVSETSDPAGLGHLLETGLFLSLNLSGLTSPSCCLGSVCLSNSSSQVPTTPTLTIQATCQPWGAPWSGPTGLVTSRKTRKTKEMGDKERDGYRINFFF